MINNDVGQILYMSRRYDEAIEEARKTFEIPELGLAAPSDGVGLPGKATIPGILAELETAVRLSGGNPGLMAYLGVAYAQAGRVESGKDTEADKSNAP